MSRALRCLAFAVLCGCGSKAKPETKPTEPAKPTAGAAECLCKVDLRGGFAGSAGSAEAKVECKTKAKDECTAALGTCVEASDPDCK